MVFFKNTMSYEYVAVCLFGLLSLVFAADAQILFTSTPSAVIVGQTYNLTWAGGDGQSQITIELRRGDSANLTWVAYLTSMYAGYHSLSGKHGADIVTQPTQLMDSSSGLYRSCRTQVTTLFKSSRWRTSPT
jgi:hypothetical protein